MKPRSEATCTCQQRVHAQEEQHAGQGIIGRQKNMKQVKKTKSGLKNETQMLLLECHLKKQ